MEGFTMRSISCLGLGLLLALAGVPASADTITSTAAGGFWSIGSTWVGGVVPGADDDVVIAGPVAVGIQEAPCRNLTVLAAGELTNANNSLRSVAASGDVLNQGTIRDNIYGFTLFVGGDMSNEGDWLQDETRISGNDDRELAMSPGSVFESNLLLAPGAAGDLLVTTPISVTGSVEIDGMRMFLGPDCPFTLEQGFFAGELYAAGNTLYGVAPYAILIDATVDDAVLDGLVNTSVNVYFSSGVDVKGTVQNYTLTGSSHVHISGPLVNEGEIRNASSGGLTIALSGDLVDNGIISNSQIAFLNAGEYHLSMDASATMDTDLFLPEIVAETLHVDTPLRSSSDIGVGIGTVILAPGNDLVMDGHSVLWTSFPGALVEANGNSIRMEGEYCSVLKVEIRSARLEGYFTVGANTAFSGGTTVADTFVNRAYNIVSAEIVDRLDNEGLITENGGSFTVILRADAENRGTWNNSRVEVDGYEDQAIGAGAGIDVPDFVLFSKLGAGPYTWTRDGIVLPGETAANLTLNGVDASDYGVYRCEGAGGTLSRLIIIDEFAEPTGATPPEAVASLAQNHPNPFNPRTEFRFSLKEAGPARLAVYDVSGREVAVLVDRGLSAGEHAVTWSPKGLSSGLYLYRLEAGGETLLRKATLLK